MSFNLPTTGSTQTRQTARGFDEPARWFKLKNDIIILNLLIGWEIIHIAKTGKKLSVRLREFPGKHSRFFRITFNKCSVATILDFVSVKTEDIACFNFIGCIFSRVEMEGEGMINIHLLKHSEVVGSLKIVSQEMCYDFTTK